MLKHMESSEIIFEREPPLAVLTLNRPHHHNALTWRMYDQIIQICAEFEAAAEIRVMIIRGAGGRAFASGTDISQFEQVQGAQGGLDYERRVEATISAVEQLSKPVIAAIEGYAVGAGAVLALVCDLRYGSATARLGIPISRTLGNCLSAANYARLLDLLGPANTKELMYLGQLAGAEQAKSLGLLNAVVAEGKAYEHARQVAAEIAERAPLTIRATKESLRRLQMHRRDVNTDDLIGQVYSSEDFREGVRSFLEHRAAHFRGY